MLINKIVCDICGAEMGYDEGYKLENRHRYNCILRKGENLMSMDICTKCAKKLFDIDEVKFTNDYQEYEKKC